MHRCLSIQEIIFHIFWDIYDDSTSVSRPPTTFKLFDLDRKQTRPDYRTLARLARTCQTFKEPALDVLWSRMETLNPLAQCLPVTKRKTTHRGTIELISPIFPNGWSKIQKYACRIHVLGSTSSSKPPFGTLTLDLIHALGSFLPLPNLRILYWRSNPEAAEYYPVIRYLLSPSIRSIYISQRTYTAVQQTIIATIGSLSPNLEQLVCCFYGASAGDGSALFQSISVGVQNLPRFRQLKVDNVGYSSSLQDIALLPHLERLVFGILPEDHLPDTPPKQLSVFSSLKAIKLKALNISRCSRFLSGIQAPVLTQLTLDLASLPFARQLQDWFSLIEAQFSPEMIKILTINVDTFARTPCDFHICSLITFKPLLSLSRLTHLRFASLDTSGLDDDNIKEIASSFPNLQAVYLGTKIYVNSSPKTTLEGLINLLARCPQLQGVGLMLDVTIIDPIALQKLSRGVVNTAITKLDVGASRIDDPDRVSLILSAVLPRLKAVENEGGKYNGLHWATRKERWDKVAEQTSLFALVRAQERRFNSMDI
ncbi:hypothetical protein BJ138DRAFT_1124160 [Hygrophoropsis aurantiaca]|uniref:Uncharacterized protein n=1 Tax=Hygrophoropsis aurantiaca TaxID=72124 RepID=A0ACB8ALQ2_9AGAM|nr:hypothetical protein BJ138DRAFT_1124160 [Hygrophoropsis aurantiaca]